MTKTVVRIGGALLMAVGMFIGIAGAMTPFLGDVDLTTGGKIMVGLMYAFLGLLLTAGGWKLLRAKR